MASNEFTTTCQPLVEISNNNDISLTINADDKQQQSYRTSSASPQSENKQQQSHSGGGSASDFFAPPVVQPEDVRVQVDSNNQPSEGRRTQSCQVDYSSSSNVTAIGSDVSSGRRPRPKTRPKPRATSCAVPAVMTTQTALVAELKDVLRRKSKFVEVVPDTRTKSPNSGDDADYYEGDDEDYDVEDEDEVALSNGGTETLSIEVGRNRSSASPFSNNSTVTSGAGVAADAARPLTPQMPQMCRNVRCAILGDECDQFFADCQSAVNHTYKRAFEVIHDGALVNLQVVAVIGVDNRDELPRFRLGNQNVDVFLTVFKDEENLQKTWMPQIRRVNAEVPIVFAGALPAADGHQLAVNLGAVDYIDVTQSSDVRPVFEAVVTAVLGPPRNNTSSATVSPSSSENKALITETNCAVKTVVPAMKEPLPVDMAIIDSSDKIKKPSKKCCCTIS